MLRRSVCTETFLCRFFAKQVMDLLAESSWDEDKILALLRQPGAGAGEAAGRTLLELGGDSLMGMRLRELIATEFHKEVSGYG
jgi:hypothetical protein